MCRKVFFFLFLFFTITLSNSVGNDRESFTVTNQLFLTRFSDLNVFHECWMWSITAPLPWFVISPLSLEGLCSGGRGSDLEHANILLWAYEQSGMGVALQHANNTHTAAITCNDVHVHCSPVSPVYWSHATRIICCYQLESVSRAHKVTGNPLASSTPTTQRSYPWNCSFETGKTTHFTVKKELAARLFSKGKHSFHSFQVSEPLTCEWAVLSRCVQRGDLFMRGGGKEGAELKRNKYNLQLDLFTRI